MVFENKKNCKMFKQVSCMCALFTIFALFFSSATPAQESKREQSSKGPSRAPANFIPDDSLEPLPLTHKVWVEDIIVPDNSGIFDQVKNDIASWQEREEYAKNWDLESTGLYKTPDIGAKKNYLTKKMVKYIDRRITGEIKSAEKGSALHTVGVVQESLKPQAEVAVAASIKVKFKARILEGQGMVKVLNPYVNYEAIVKVDGRVSMYATRRINSIGIDTQVDYNVNDGIYTASIHKRLSDNITTRIASSQRDDKMFFSGDSDNSIAVFFHAPF